VEGNAMSPRWWISASLVVATVLAGLAMLPAQSRSSTKGQKVALLVGVNRYDNKGLSPLKYAENDVEELEKELTRPSAGFAKVRVLTTSRGKKDKKDAPTAANIRKALDELLKDKGRHDLVLVALSGRGIQLGVADPAGKKEAKTYAYFCPSDARLTGVSFGTGSSKYLIHLSEMFGAIGECDAGAKLVLMDASREERKEGRIRSLNVEDVRIPRGVAALFSCSSGQQAFEVEKLKHGLFFHSVLEGLRGGARNRTGAVTFGGLAAYVNYEVRSSVAEIVGGAARQEPHLIANLAGQSAVLTRVDVVQEKEFSNSIGMKLVPIPVGKFTMGSPVDEKGRGADEYQHAVEITEPFYLGAHAVTQAQYRKVMGKNPSHFSLTGIGKRAVGRFSTDDFPVERVSWHEAVEFCKNLSALPEEKAARRFYRLPAEAEWEYACRAGSSTPFHFGNTISSRLANYGGKLGRTRKVGSYKPNAFGLYDMHGNVWQWCLDWYGKDYYRTAVKNDPQGPTKGQHRVVRGGAWNEDAANCRSATRAKVPPDKRNNGAGFRVVCVRAVERQKMMMADD
jgi:formylglycine-generating enzyme required for sulfatase activity